MSMLNFTRIAIMDTLDLFEKDVLAMPEITTEILIQLAQKHGFRVKDEGHIMKDVDSFKRGHLTKDQLFSQVVLNGLNIKHPKDPGGPIMEYPEVPPPNKLSSLVNFKRDSFELPQQLLQKYEDFSNPLKQLLDKVHSINPQAADFLANHKSEVANYIGEMQRKRMLNYDEMAKRLVNVLSPTKQGGFIMPDFIRLAAEALPQVDSEIKGTPEFGKKTEIHLSVTFPSGLEYKQANKLKVKLEKLVQKALRDNTEFEYSVHINETVARTPKKSSSFIVFEKLS